MVRADLGRLLTQIFPSVLIPQAVADELLAKDTPDKERIVALLTTLQIVPLAKPIEPMLATELDKGEAAVLQLASERQIRGVLIDKKKARKVASLIYRLEVRGTAALMLEAKNRKLIPSVGDALNMMAESGYFIGPNLRAECLKRAGE